MKSRAPQLHLEYRFYRTLGNASKWRGKLGGGAPGGGARGGGGGGGHLGSWAMVVQWKEPMREVYSRSFIIHSLTVLSFPPYSRGNPTGSLLWSMWKVQCDGTGVTRAKSGGSL